MMNLCFNDEPLFNHPLCKPDVHLRRRHGISCEAAAAAADPRLHQTLHFQSISDSLLHLLALDASVERDGHVQKLLELCGRTRSPSTLSPYPWRSPWSAARAAAHSAALAPRGGDERLGAKEIEHVREGIAMRSSSSECIPALSRGVLGLLGSSL